MQMIHHQIFSGERIFEQHFELVFGVHSASGSVTEAVLSQKKHPVIEQSTSKRRARNG